MEMIQGFLLTILLAVWICISVGFFVAVVQNIIMDHRREKRNQAQLLRDLEYHEKRMKDYN